MLAALDYCLTGLTRKLYGDSSICWLRTLSKSMPSSFRRSRSAAAAASISFSWSSNSYARFKGDLGARMGQWWAVTPQPGKAHNGSSSGLRVCYVKCTDSKPSGWEEPGPRRHAICLWAGAYTPAAERLDYAMALEYNCPRKILQCETTRMRTGTKWELEDQG